MQDSDKKVHNCYFELALDLISGKWKLIILYHISKEENIRYRRLKELIPEINERMLTKQLRVLEKNEIINRVSYNEIPPRVEYSLTDSGSSLLAVVSDLEAFGRDYYKKIGKKYFQVDEDELCL